MTDPPTLTPWLAIVEELMLEAGVIVAAIVLVIVRRRALVAAVGT